MTPRANLATITNALGHITQITQHDARGRPLRIEDPNGLVTTLAYDARGRLIARTVGTETTTYAYNGVGQLTRVTLPDGSFLNYSYDAAHRLTGVTDSLGNRIVYTLDLMGNRLKEETFDPQGALTRLRSQVYNALNRLQQTLGASPVEVTRYTYDNNGNLATCTDPLSHVTTNAYDGLNRLVRSTDPNNSVTQYGYDSQDHSWARRHPGVHYR